MMIKNIMRSSNPKLILCHHNTNVNHLQNRGPYLLKGSYEVHIHVNIYESMFLYILYTNTYTLIHTYMHIHIYTYILYTYIYIYIFLWIYICIPKLKLPRGKRPADRCRGPGAKLSPIILRHAKGSRCFVLKWPYYRAPVYGSDWSLCK